MMDISKETVKNSQNKLEVENSTITDENFNLKRSKSELLRQLNELVGERELVLSDLADVKEHLRAARRNVDYLQERNNSILQTNQKLRENVTELTMNNKTLDAKVCSLTQERQQLQIQLLKPTNRIDSEKLDRQSGGVWIDPEPEDSLSVSREYGLLNAKMACRPTGSRVTKGYNEDEDFDYWQDRMN